MGTAFDNDIREAYKEIFRKGTECRNDYEKDSHDLDAFFSMWSYVKCLKILMKHFPELKSYNEELLEEEYTEMTVTTPKD